MENKTKLQKQQMKKYLEQREEKIAYAKKWNKENMHKTKRYQRKYQKSICSRLSEYNSDINKRKREEELGFKNKCFLLSLHTQFLNGTNDYFSKYINHMSLEDYKGYIESLWDNDMSWDNYGTKWQIRRIKGWKCLDLTSEDDIREFCSLNNIKLFRINSE